MERVWIGCRERGKEGGKGTEKVAERREGIKREKGGR